MQIPIWQKTQPDIQPKTKPEEMRIMNNHLVAGKSWINVGTVITTNDNALPSKGKKYRSGGKLYSRVEVIGFWPFACLKVWFFRVNLAPFMSRYL